LPLSFLVTIAIAGLALVPIVAKLARLWLDRQPTAQHVKNIALYLPNE
jgi:antibiotic biosynthesis monooxygenase (ABM) superfamily enzyme